LRKTGFADHDRLSRRGRRILGPDQSRDPARWQILAFQSQRNIRPRVLSSGPFRPGLFYLHLALLISLLL